MGVGSVAPADEVDAKDERTRGAAPMHTLAPFERRERRFLTMLL
jgi:hypothetical protein